MEGSLTPHLQCVNTPRIAGPGAYTDTAGATAMIVALCALWGERFAPRRRARRARRVLASGAMDRQASPRLPPPVTGRLTCRRSLEPWDARLRGAGSMTRGSVPASLLVHTLQAPQ